RKYTYVGYSGLHQPLYVCVTPEFFIYNEEFHSCDSTNYMVKELIQKKKKKDKELHNNVNSNKNDLFVNNTKKHINDKNIINTNSICNEDIISVNVGSVINYDETYVDVVATEKQKLIQNTKIASSENVKSKIKEKTTDYVKKGSECQFQSSENSCIEQTVKTEINISHKKKKILYHYEYKYNQDINLWCKFFNDFYYNIFHNVIKTSNKVKKVIVVLNMFIPNIIKYCMCKCLIETTEHCSISYINDLVSPLYLCNCNTCIVIDLGYLNCRILPVLNGFPLYYHFTYINNGGIYINKEIKKLLKEQYINAYLYKKETSCNVLSSASDDYDDVDFNTEKLIYMSNNNNNRINNNKNNDDFNYLFDNYLNMYTMEEILNVIDNITDNELENIKITCCYLENKKINLTSNKYIIYKINNYDIIITPDIRRKSCEILFTKSYKQNFYSLFSTILNKLNISEYSVLNNIVLVGGCSNIKGIVSRLTETVFKVLKNKNICIQNLENKINFIFPKISPNLRQFIGASVYANLDNLPSYTREHIDNNVLFDHLNEDVYFMFKKF
ncbi:actin-like protein, putative, partial [Hepatocystis sp. ex Piliocolobus tephrosceles]